MSDYVKMNMDITASPTSAASVAVSILPQEDTKLYSQTHVKSSTAKVDDTPYVPSDKITVRKYRLYKTKETL